MAYNQGYTPPTFDLQYPLPGQPEHFVAKELPLPASFPAPALAPVISPVPVNAAAQASVIPAPTLPSTTIPTVLSATNSPAVSVTASSTTPVTTFK